MRHQVREADSPGALEEVLVADEAGPLKCNSIESQNTFQQQGGAVLQFQCLYWVVWVLWVLWPLSSRQARQDFSRNKKRRENFFKILGVLSSLASLDKFKFGAIWAISGATVPTVANIDTFDPGLIFLVKYIYIPWSPSVWAH